MVVSLSHNRTNQKLFRSSGYTISTIPRTGSSCELVVEGWTWGAWWSSDPGPLCSSDIGRLSRHEGRGTFWR